MSAGIMESDQGIVWGTTWHRLPQYRQQDVPVELPDALRVLGYPIEKRPLYRHLRPAADGRMQRTVELAEAWEVVRTDTQAVLVPHVGRAFDVLPNSYLLQYIGENLLTEMPELKIESVGTLWNGATAFVNLVVERLRMVPGDKSETLSRLMYYNPLGEGAYRVCAHTVRVVCNNTLQAAAAQGGANATLSRIRHTRMAAEKINDKLIDLAQLKLGLKKNRELMGSLAAKEMSTVEAERFLDQFFPAAVDSKGSVAQAVRRREAVIDLFESDQDLKGVTARSRYAMLQAVMAWVDHRKPPKDSDLAEQDWNGLVGSGSRLKQEALELLSALPVAA